MKKKTSVLVLTGAITISNIGLTTSFADVNDETLLIQEKSTIVHSQVSIETDGSARIAGQDGQLGTADDVFVRPGANGQAPHVDQFGNVTVPTGGRVELPDGNIVWDTGNDQSIVVPAGTVITPNGNGGVPTVNPDGTVNVPEGSMVVLPNGDDVTPGSGSVVSPNGSVANQDGSIINPDGSITGGNTNKPGEDVNKPSEDTNKPGEDANKPEDINKPSVNGTKPSENTNKPTENVTKPSTNPNTGDRSVMGMLVVGSMALLALVKNLKIKDKLFLK